MTYVYILIYCYRAFTNFSPLWDLTFPDPLCACHISDNQKLNICPRQNLKTHVSNYQALGHDDVRGSPTLPSTWYEIEVSCHLNAAAALTPPEKSGTLWITYWVGSKASLDAVKRRTFLAPTENRTQNPRSSSP
jgi:hypothetical protein